MLSNLLVAVLDGDIERSPAQGVDGVHLSASIDQRANEMCVRRPRNGMQDCSETEVDRMAVGAEIKEQLDHGQVAANHGCMQRGSVLAVPGIDLGAGLDQQSDRVHMATKGGNVQCSRVILSICDLEVSTGSDERPHDRISTDRAGEIEQRPTGFAFNLRRNTNNKQSNDLREVLLSDCLNELQSVVRV